MLLALSIQRGYALSNDVTVLVAGFNQPWKSFSGTGIYLRDGGVAEAFYTDAATNRLIVREVPNIQTNACVTVTSLTSVLESYTLICVSRT